jgi:hypothetical protein
MARAHFDWNSLDDAKEYDDKQREHNEGRVHDPTLQEPAYPNWEHNPAECGCRIWLWWRIRVYEVQEFEYIPVALRLVALVQPSSCGIERVFSQLKLVLDSCGDSVLESTLESRLFRMLLIYRVSARGSPAVRRTSNNI